MNVASINSLREQLRLGCNSVPVDKYQSWDYQRVLAFKATVRECKKIAAKDRASANELQAAINKLATFW